MDHSSDSETARLHRRIAELEGRLREREAEIARLAGTALTASDRELLAIFRAMTDVVLVLDREGRYLKVAPTRPDLLYAPSIDLVGRTIREAIGPEAEAQFLPPILRALETRQVVYLEEYALPIQGRNIWFSGSVSPMTEDSVVFVARDITDRKDAIEQRVRQEELIRAQSLMLAQLSSPLIPISDSIVVMPLIGALDEARVHRITESLLTGIIDQRARVAIIDVTGVTEVTASLAEMIVRAAHATRLLGANVILSGIRPNVAKSLVEIGADLGDIACHTNLKNAIASAMAAFAG
ncbi:PAS domain-containing protein [Pendulispora brunnea]|uniref:PAS domain-containing protein n=1 Tax=Pendulispora brunnea TaxID=2905690 RepID=A0ABZ2K6P5_9BACT